jgi:membrane-associated phospholipid phosphatase
MAVMKQAAVLFRPPHLPGILLLAVALLVTCFVPQYHQARIHAFGHVVSHGFHDTYLTLSILYLLVTAWVARSKALFWNAAAPLGAETAIMQTIQKASFHVWGLWPRPSGTDGGFPSGHAAATCVVAYLLTQRFPRLGLLWYGIAGLISWSRWQDNAHYPYQIVAGAVLGLTCAATLAPRLPSPPRDRAEAGAPPAAPARERV